MAGRTGFQNHRRWTERTRCAEMHMKERATYSCKSGRCGSLTRLPCIRSAEIGKHCNAQTSDDTERSRASSKKRPSNSSRKRPSRVSQKRPKAIRKHESCTNLMSQTLLSVAAKLEKVFNNSATPHHRVKRVYVIRFDDKNSDSTNRCKKYTRVLYEGKSGKQENTKTMKRATSASPNRARYPSTASDDGVTRSLSTNDRSGDAPDTSPEHSVGDDDEIEKDFDKMECRRTSWPWNNLQSELGKPRVISNASQFREAPVDKTSNYKVYRQERAQRSPQTDQIAEIFGAILKEIENLNPKKVGGAESPKKKTLSEIIESDQSLVSADYTIPPSMLNEKAVNVLQALIDHKRKPRKKLREGRKSSRSSQRFGSLSRPLSSMEWYGLREPLNYTAEIFSEPEVNIAASSSAGSGPICRICHERLGTLVRPCRCRGSMAYVHLECLQMWLTEKEINYCELCNYVFRVIHVPEYRLVPSIGFWYKFAATNQQRRRILIDLTLAVILLPVLIFVTLFARSCNAEYPEADLDDDLEYVSVPFSYYHEIEEDNWITLGWLLLVYALKFLTFLLNLLYVGAVFVRINHHLGTWLSWYVNKNVTVVLEDRHPGSVRTVGTGDDILRPTSE